jgi:quercetin dioxygenase-like cupin family protein
MTARRIAWTQDQALWRGELQGAEFGSEVSIIFNRIDRPGEGPELHRHPYSETFIVRRGTVVFSGGMSTFEASAGEIVVVPAGVPHRFTCKSEQVEMVDIHASHVRHRMAGRAHGTDKVGRAASAATPVSLTKPQPTKGTT